MNRFFLTVLVLGLIFVPVAALAVPPGLPPLAGTWTTTDCAQWWEGGDPMDCDLWGDESTLSLTIRPGQKPQLSLVDDYSETCDEAGEPSVFVALGKGFYEVDQPEVRTLNATFPRSGCGRIGPPEPWVDLPLYWDPGSDTLWSDVPWDDTDLWGYTWVRVP